MPAPHRGPATPRRVQRSHLHPLECPPNRLGWTTVGRAAMKPVVAGDAALVCKEAVPDRTEPLPADPPIYESREIGEILRRKAKRVVTFLGFGELGYEDEARMRDIARGEMERHAPERTIVNTSTLITNGFRHGIADVYGIAKWRGFE